ncbi:MAG TPA: tetratricopeptide repeat protein [Gallionella sp.]|nr:tetratricopeptide repeat protein [Gallionella sp.]
MIRFPFSPGFVSALVLSSYLAPVSSAYAGEEVLAIPEPYVVAQNDLLVQLGVSKETERKEENPLSGKAYRLADQAYKALAEGKIDEAEGFINEALQLRPDNKQLGLIFLDIQMRKGDLKKARSQADNLLTRFPNDVLVLVSRGYISQRQNRHDLAVQDFSAALRQPGLDTAQQRNVRLSLADSAIAIKQPQQALDTLVPLVTPESYAVQIRIAQARLMMGDRNAARAAGEQANKLAANDAERKPAQQLLLSASVPVDKPLPVAKPKPTVQTAVVKSAVNEGYELLSQGKDKQALEAFQRAFAAGQGSATTYADAGYTARRLGEHDVAADLLNKALKQSPGLDAAHERDVRLNLADGAFAKQQPQEVLDVLATMLTEDSYAVQIRLGQAYMMLAQRDAARAAAEWANKRATTDDQRAYAQALLKNINASTDLVHVDGGYADLNEGYRKLGEHKDKEALAAFQRAFANGYGSAANYADAGYAAKRLGDNKTAVELMGHALEINEKSPESAKPFNDDQAIGYRREMQEMSRKWGFTASLVRQRTLLAGRQRTNTIQGGLEGYWQPYNDNGRFVQLYARTYQTFHEGIIVGTNGSGTATNQGAAGVRVKPFTDWGLTLGVERLIHFGMFSRMDWLARIGFSTDSGYELKPGKAALADWNFYGEAGYYFEPNAGNNAGGGGAGNGYYYHTMEATYGKSMHLSGIDAHLTAYPHLVATNETDNSRSPRARSSSSTIGPGVKFRYWFSEDKYEVPGSVIDLDIQYRFKVDNAPRGSGLLMRANYWF